MSHQTSEPAFSPQSENLKKQNFNDSTSISSQNALSNKKNSVDSTDMTGSMEYAFLDEYRSPSLSTDSLKNISPKPQIPDSKPCETFTLKTNDGKTFVGSFTKENSFVLLNDELSKDPIFFKLCDKKNYNNTEKCFACSASFNFILKRKRTCKFCGHNYCDQHFNKMRADPRDKSRYHEICDFCEENYLTKKINDMYIQKFQKRNRTVKNLECDGKRLEAKMKEKNDIICQLKQMIESKKIENLKKIKNIEEQIMQKKNDTAKLERENVIANQEFVEVNHKIRNQEFSLSEMEKELLCLDEELTAINKELSLLEEEISDKNENLYMIETKIVQNKLKLKNNLTGSAINRISKQNTLNGDIFKNSYQTANSFQNIPSAVARKKGNQRKDDPPEYNNYYGYCSLF